MRPGLSRATAALPGAGLAGQRQPAGPGEE